ncbi:hypothetical protein [Mucilaginibacter segetis]|uniref:Uncharacterized protein n=1 Tax=Mucilaginibacter segetis TaxID=2793071 RepID=A0A934PTF1_9SPHI|nr:hypothetical protein [Mucilaginibacter segetis]MBK0379262.1 hypothetical protein [Mucilaginibacter segetis]
MNEVNQPFELQITDPNGTEVSLQVSHESETFDMDYRGKPLSLLNNGDNTWSSLKGALDQETVNLIGAAIEQYYRHLKP